MIKEEWIVEGVSPLSWACRSLPCQANWKLERVPKLTWRCSENNIISEPHLTTGSFCPRGVMGGDSLDLGDSSSFTNSILRVTLAMSNGFVVVGASEVL